MILYQYSNWSWTNIWFHFNFRITWSQSYIEGYANVKYLKFQLQLDGIENLSSWKDSRFSRAKQVNSHSANQDRQHDSLQHPAPYIVLDTDYDSYSLVYSCIHLILDTKYEIYWILSRTKVLNQDILQKVMTELRMQKVDISLFKKINQNC